RPRRARSFAPRRARRRREDSRGARSAGSQTRSKPLFTDLAYRSRDDLDLYNDFCEEVGIRGRLIAKIRGMMQNMERDDLARLLEPSEVENIKRAQNPIGMAINRIRTIERESGRPKEMKQRKGQGKGSRQEEKSAAEAVRRSRSRSARSKA
ncbi:Uncharacterized protein SCF082_LOCUS30960, partial [Durusdinium trenchii]